MNHSRHFVWKPDRKYLFSHFSVVIEELNQNYNVLSSVLFMLHEFYCCKKIAILTHIIEENSVKLFGVLQFHQLL